jgi:hypothetical protein
MLDEIGAITLDQARQKARGWLSLIAQGIDPKAEEARQRAAARRQQVNTFAAVAAEFLERHAAGLKKRDEAKRIIEREFVKRWGARPVTDIMPEEVAAAVRAIVKRGAPYQAPNALVMPGVFSIGRSAPTNSESRRRPSHNSSQRT